MSATTTEEIALTEIRHEAEVDTMLAENWGEVAKLRNSLDSIRVQLHQLLSIRSQRIGRSYDYPHSLRTVAAMVEEKLPTMSQWDAPKAREVLDNIVTVNEAIEAKYAEAAPLEWEYDAKQWSRFFLVQNNNGHIHSSMSCSTCRYDTSFAWLPKLSGMTEKDAVEEHGAILCSVCYPSAPVEWTNGVSKVAQAEKDARAAEKAAKAAAKAEKAITAADGSTLRGYGSYGGEIKTLVTARRELISIFKDRLYYGDEDQARFEHAVYIAEAINAKTGEDIEELLIQAEYKASAIVRKEQS